MGLTTVPDRVDGVSRNGSGTVDLPCAPYKVTAETGNGRTRVDMPRETRSGHVVTAHSGHVVTAHSGHVVTAHSGNCPVVVSGTS
ncbi:hypothetical protein ACFOSC_18175 [Streptantibioticus rubrisoli]|uniref:Uncharacterized protein n=1 Tax=Streptantibioticus rubrisoli TaxID=1387313 RepID=A0ABT1PH15_9ACTN|nr:hypothetical protein [Streptantibioticus rubrisoli]MCQ4044639.1 hypothetical protein [Streptantibioticus rubrisoli]